ncbi:MAG: hypothetical protein IJS29_08680 [Selenomonadaceae bacterium]|nr:hypothetical protein [Selenomonadaceae bacterium]
MIAYSVSHYAAKNSSELIAESVSDYIINGEDAADFSKALRKQLKIAFTIDEWTNFVFKYKEIQATNLTAESALKWVETRIKKRLTHYTKLFERRCLQQKFIS